MYSVSTYGAMIADDARMNAYVEALRRAVTPDSIVIDIGAGTGIFSLLACQFGARRVYAIEPADAIQVAREIAATNGYAERIEFIQKLSTDFELPERADVIISDIRGLLPFLGCHISSIADARARLLKPGGTLIPQRDDVWVTIVEAEELYNDYLSPWEKYDLDMSAAKRIVTNTHGWSVKNVSPEILFTDPQLWVSLDYSVVSDPNVVGAMNFTANREGTAHGLFIWFDATMAEGVGFSNAPGVENPTKVYGRSFFPWSSPVGLNVGDQIDVRLEARLVGENYIYRWETTVRPQQDSQNIKAHFNQSNFYGEPLSIGNLRKQSDAYIPELNPEGMIDHYILTQMTGQTPLGEIAKHLAEHYPQKFPRWQDALTRVGELAGKYSK
jgi:protein arginine N-methyltransferase 1